MVRAVDVPASSIIDALFGHREPVAGTRISRIITIADIATQLLGSGPLADFLDLLQENQVSALIPYELKADMLADLTPAAGVGALVIGDTAENNGIYKKIGASGSGSWSAKISSVQMLTNQQVVDLTTLITNLLAVDGLSVDADNRLLLDDGFDLARVQVDDNGTVWLNGVGIELTTDSLFENVDPWGYAPWSIDFDGNEHSAGSDDDVGQASVSMISSGAQTDTGFQVVADVTGGELVRLEVSADENFFVKAFTSSVLMPDATERSVGVYNYTVRFDATGLASATQWYYRFVVDGHVLNTVGRCKTLPTPGAAVALRYALGSCLDVNFADQALPVVTALEDINLDFIVLMGDAPYSNIESDDILLPRANNWRFLLSNAHVQALALRHGIIYQPDDHDMASNNPHWGVTYDDGVTYMEVAANTRQVFRETIPHHPFAAALAGETDPEKVILARSFKAARTKFIILDALSLRKYTTSGGALPGDKTYIGNATNPPGQFDQFGWLQDEILEAGSSGMRFANIICTSAIRGTGGSWHDQCPDELISLLDWIRDTPGIPQVIFDVGDFHQMLATVSGTDLSTGGGLTVPMIMSSPMDNFGGIDARGEDDWNGVATRIIGNQNFTIRDIPAASNAFSSEFYGPTFDGVTGAATLLATYDSTDADPTVGFDDTTVSGPAGTIVNVQINKEWFGPINGTAGGTVDWATNDAQSGTAIFRPNQGKTTIPVTSPAVVSNSITIALSNPTAGIVIDPAADEATLTAT